MGKRRPRFARDVLEKTIELTEPVLGPRNAAFEEAKPGQQRRKKVRYNYHDSRQYELAQRR